MDSIVEHLVQWVTDVINAFGYVGVAFLIALESIFPPIPSELILPLGGSLAATGQFNFFLVLLSATVGSVAGASVLYGVGRWAGGGRIGRWLDRHGKWLLLSRADLDHTTAWFHKHGTWAVLTARLIPGLRSLISIPAGISEMPILRFLLLTAIGSATWNGALIGAGYFLGSNWHQIERWLDPVSPIVYGLLILAAVFFFGKRLWSQLHTGNRNGERPVEEGDVEGGSDDDQEGPRHHRASPFIGT
jgi:membrane protein DedA with SNARE-associated domain